MSAHPFGLSGKTILVTGASSGIGSAMVKIFSHEDSRLIICGRSEQRLKEVHNQLKNPASHVVSTVDLKDEGSIVKFVETLPSLDGIVFNAGMVKLAPLKFLKSQDVHELFQVNVLSSMILIQQLLKGKKINEGGSICFISSIASQNVTLGNSVYSATKGAVNSFTKSVALELAPRKIRVNAIMPGFIETNLMNDQSVSAEQLEIHKNNYPLGRFGQSKDVALLAQYLLSEASAFMTGSLLTLDGGYSLK
jgi:NAD(P)-dependent dehydrogenase (short-subunit alcohol dehydrogenase family)